MLSDTLCEPLRRRDANSDPWGIGRVLPHLSYAVPVPGGCKPGPGREGLWRELTAPRAGIVVILMGARGQRVSMTASAKAPQRRRRMGQTRAHF